MLNAEVVKVPGMVVPVVLEDGATVGDAFEAAGTDYEGFDIKIDGDEVDTSTELNDGDRIFLTKQIKGN